MKKNVNKIRKEVKGLKMADFSFPGNAHLFWGWWENQSYAKWWHCESTISLPQFHTSWASIFQAQKKILSILFFFSAQIMLMMFFWMRGWETNTVLGLIKHRKAFWLFQHNCPFLFSLVDSGSVYSTIHNMQQPTDSYFSSAVTVNLPSRKVNDLFLCLLQHVNPEFWVPGVAHSQSSLWSFCSSYQDSLISPNNKICDYFCTDSHVHIFNG